MSRRRSGGFTLVELLVVITIIGILIALLLPAVNYAVENARSNQCKNNLRQLGVAANSFHTSKERFPGYANQLVYLNNGNNANMRVSWVVSLMPYYERQDLYDMYQQGNTSQTPYIDMLNCPSDPPDTNNGPHLAYVANAGYQKYSDANTSANYDNESINNGVFHNHYQNTSHAKPMGPAITNTQFTDGVTNTLLMTENVQASSWANAVANGAGSANDKRDAVFVWFTSENADRKINGNKNTASLSADTARPSSHHPGGVNVVYADGRVQWLKQDIAYHVYIQLMTPRHKDMVKAFTSNIPANVQNYILNEGDIK